MVAFGVGGATPKQRMTQVAAGLGLLRTTVIDQHFDQRNRYGRLLMIVSQSPQLLGIGVDEDTCATVTVEDGHEVLRVSGRGAVTLLDPQRLVTNAYEAKRSTPLLASGIVLHVLPAGAAYDLTTRELRPGRPGLGGGRRRAGRGAGGPAADGPRHRGRRPLPGHSAATSGPQAPTPEDCPHRPTTSRRRRRAGRSTTVTERPTPDLTILETRVYRGPNIWSYDKAIHLVVDLGRSSSTPPTSSPASPTTCSRRSPASRTTPAPAAARAASSSACTKAPGSGTSPSTRRSPCSRSSATTSGAARRAG